MLPVSSMNISFVYKDMASLYYWIGKHNNNNQEQEEKFAMVKGALLKGSYTEDERGLLCSRSLWIGRGLMVLL
jgi:hypothetical protein